MFDLRRFGRLAAVQWAERGREYLWFLAIGIGVHTCTWLVITQAGRHMDHYEQDTQSVLYWLGYAITALIFAGRHFTMLAQRDAALTWLMRPASAFEKCLLTFLVVAVAYPLAYTLAFQVCNLPGAALAIGAESARQEWQSAREMGPYLPFANAEKRFAQMGCVLGIATLQSLVLVGMLYFRRLSWLKTLVAVFVLLMIVLPLLTIVADASVEKLFPGYPVVPVGWGVRAWLWTLWIGTPGMFWISVYGFLRDRELS